MSKREKIDCPGVSKESYELQKSSSIFVISFLGWKIFITTLSENYFVDPNLISKNSFNFPPDVAYVIFMFCLRY